MIDFHGVEPVFLNDPQMLRRFGVDLVNRVSDVNDGRIVFRPVGMRLASFQTEAYFISAAAATYAVEMDRLLEWTGRDREDFPESDDPLIVFDGGVDIYRAGSLLDISAAESVGRGRIWMACGDDVAQHEKDEQLKYAILKGTFDWKRVARIRGIAKGWEAQREVFERETYRRAFRKGACSAGSGFGSR
jgi:hypothetical protein